MEDAVIATYATIIRNEIATLKFKQNWTYINVIEPLSNWWSFGLDFKVSKKYNP